MAVSITSQLIMEAARKRGWRAELYHDGAGLYTVTLPDGREFFLKAMRSYKSGMVNDFIANNKSLAQSVVSDMGVRTPDTLSYISDESSRAFLTRHGNIVVKPLDSSHGLGVTVAIDTVGKMQVAIAKAKKYSSTVLLQQHIEGDDYRVLIIDKQLAAAVIRKPAFVAGDGTRTIWQRRALENSSGKRGSGYQKPLSLIDIQAAREYLGSDLKAVPANGKEVRVMGVANIGRGGVSEDVTETLDSGLKEDAIRLTGQLRLSVCGVDFIKAQDGTHYFIEMNTRPSLGLHEYPYKGHSRGTPDKFLDWLVKDA